MPNPIAKKRHLAFIITSLIVCAMIQILPISSGKSQSVSTVKGTIMDSSGAVIVMPTPTIIFKRNDEIRSVVADGNGNYEITLTPGVYTVTTEIAGFYPIRRAEFCLLPGSAVMINLVPTPRYLVRGTTVAFKSADIPAPRPKYDEFRVPGRGFNMLLQFEKKRRANKSVEYDQAIMTYDSLTIYADKLFFDAARLQLRASGKPVIVENGKQRFEVKEAEVTFKAGEANLKMVR